ncbi:hypothetical protein HQ576_12080, partial [bacterium]|nr:hypothetical protein [bacterium]
MQRLAHAVLVVALASALANAGTPGDRATWFRRRLKQDDKNGDGQVSRDEFTGPARLWQTLDHNRDGTLDAKETDQHAQRLTAATRPG